MSFSIFTNLSALQAYNALAKVNSQSLKAQARLSSGKRINTAADDTSGYRVGKALEGKAVVQKAQLNNAASAKNYLGTAEASLQLVTDLLNQIEAKYTDSQDATKNQAAIANDIRSLGSEIDSIIKNTKMSGINLLAQPDGTALTRTDIYDIGDSITMDFASDTYLKVGDLNTAINGSTTSDPGVANYDGINYDKHGTSLLNMDISSVIKVTYADGSTQTANFSYTSGTYDFENGEIESDLLNAFEATTDIRFTNAGGDNITDISDASNGKNIVSLVTTSGYDITTAFGITRTSTASSGGFVSTDDSEVFSAASNISTIRSNVQNALGRIGNLTQTVDVRSDYLTDSIANNTVTISRLFDADMAEEQLNATKGTIAGQIGTSMLSQANSNPQLLLSLFK